MKYIKKFNESFEDDDLQDDDLALELEYKIRTLEDGSEYTLDDFFDEFGVDADFRSDFAFAAILKQKAERFDEMSDEEFFEFYENNRL